MTHPGEVVFKRLDLLGEHSRLRNAAERLSLTIAGMNSTLFAELIDSSVVIGAKTSQQELAGIAIVSFNDPACHIEALAVHESTRHQGVGTELLVVAEECAAERGVHLITAVPVESRTGTDWDENAARFFVAHGYEVVDGALRPQMVKSVAT